MPFRKQKIETPESMIQGANIHVEAQKEQFKVMRDEVQYAISQRQKAIIELDKEIQSLTAQLMRKQDEMQKAKDYNKVDVAYMNRIEQFIG